MGFYQPFTLIKDAQRHGLKVLPIDVTRSDWFCTIEKAAGTWGRGDGETGGRGDAEMGGNRDAETRDFGNAENEIAESPHLPVSLSPRLGVPASPLVLRLGLKYVKGLSQESGNAIVRERIARPFTGIDDLRNRVPELHKDELKKLAAIGALNFIQDPFPERSLVKVNRRDALWQVERVVRSAGELYEGLPDRDGNSPLLPMTIPERLNADFRGTGLTIGKHPVAYHRSELNKLGALRAIDIAKIQDGHTVRIAGWVIVRQRPGTAKGFMFLTLEDETGVSNVIVTPQLFDRNRLVLVDQPFLLIEGALQNQDNVVSVKAKRIHALQFDVGAAPSHDFH